jgi:nucleolar complex protein 2
MNSNVNFRHKSELEDLKAKDPEFYAYLEQNDTSLLDFGVADSYEDLDEEISLESETSSDELGEGIKQNLQKSVRRSKSIDVTDQLLQKIIERVESGSIKELQKLLRIFKFACQPYTDDDEWNDEDVASSKQSFTISSAEMYQSIVTKTIEAVHVCFRMQFNLSFPYLRSELQDMINHPKWKKLSFCLFSFFQIYLQNIKSLESQTQHRHVLLYFLKSFKDYIPFAFPVEKIHKRMYKVLISLWSSYYHSDEDLSEIDHEKKSITVESSDEGGVVVKDTHHEVRGESVILLLQMMKFLPNTIVEEITKKVYLQFAKVANKPFTEHSSSSFAFFIHSACEIFTFDKSVAYQQSFLYIRQLALHLRNAFMKKGIESVKVVKTWQYIHCCRLWTKVITTSTQTQKSDSFLNNGSESDLSMLAFPLSQILLGVLSLLPSAYYIPLRYHLVACLQQLAIHCKLFIPTAASLVETLEFSDLFSKPSPATSLPQSLSYLITLPPESLLQQSVRNQVVQETLRLLRLDADIYTHNNGFPEYAMTIIRKVRQFIKRCTSSSQRRWREEAKSLLKMLAIEIDSIESSRAFANETITTLEKKTVKVINPSNNIKFVSNKLTNSDNVLNRKTHRRAKQNENLPTQLTKTDLEKAAKINIHSELNKAKVEPSLEEDDISPLTSWD